jgi:hypothetical protein
MSISIDARGLDELAARIAKQRTLLRPDLEALIDMQLSLIQRVLMAATPLGHSLTSTKTAHESMRQSWHKQRNGLAGKVWNDRPYAGYLFTGTRPHAIPGAFGYPAPFGENPDFHPGTSPNDALVTAFTEQVVDASTRFRQFGLGVTGKIAGKVVNP